MEKLMLDNSEVLADHNLESLLYNSKEWKSEVDMWKQELKFFQKLLDKNVSSFSSVEQKQKLDHFQNLIIYYDGELLDFFRQKARRHAKYLSAHVENGKDLNKEEYQEKFGTVNDQLNAFASEFRKYKKDFFQFIEEALDKN